jgi:hypothetical protein
MMGRASADLEAAIKHSPMWPGIDREPGRRFLPVLKRSG